MINKPYDAINVANQAKAMRGEYLSELLGIALNGILKSVKRSKTAQTGTCQLPHTA